MIAGTIYEFIIKQFLTTTRYREKRIRFAVDDLDAAKKIFFAKHPEYSESGFYVSARRMNQSGHGCILPDFKSAQKDLDSELDWLRRNFPEKREQQLLAKHLIEYAKKIKWEWRKIGT